MKKHWKVEFDEAVFESDSVEKIQNLKNGQIPQKLFKYRTFDENGFWEDWAQGKVFCNTPLNFNDPFDCILTFESTSYIQTKRDVCFEAIRSRGIELSSTENNCLKTDKDPINTLVAILEGKGIPVNEDILSRIESPKCFQSSLQKMLRVACFSEKNDSLLMWGHYADQNKRFCLEYDFSDASEISEFLFSVVYSGQKVIINTGIQNENVLKVALCKSEKWEYEQEWRYINMLRSTSESPTGTTIPYFDSPINAVYFGAKTDQTDIDRLLNLTSKNSAIPKYYHMEMLDSEYKLIPRPLS